MTVDDDRARLNGYGSPSAMARSGRHPPPGVKQIQRWRSPLRGLWLTSVFGSALLATLPIVIITGLLSYIAYGPQFGQAIPGDVGWLKLPTFDWPTEPVLAVPAQPGPACRSRPDPHSGRARQAVVGDSAAVRLAAGTVDRPSAGTHFAADAGRRDPLRDHHRRAEHSVRLHLRVQLLHRPLLRRLGVHRRFRRSTSRSRSRGCGPDCGPCRCGTCCAPTEQTPFPSRTSPTDWWPRTRRLRRSAAAARSHWSAAGRCSWRSSPRGRRSAASRDRPRCCCHAAAPAATVPTTSRSTGQRGRRASHPTPPAIGGDSR